MTKAWEWRDKVQVHAGAGNWSPVDYAPHLWREYQELLLGHEMRYRLGVAWTESDLGRAEGPGRGRCPPRADSAGGPSVGTWPRPRVALRRKRP